jgi:hypothetical protein
MADRREAGTPGLSLAGLLQGRDDPDVGGERGGRSEARRVADLGDDPRRTQGPDAVNRGQEAADLVDLEQPLDVALARLQALAPEDEVPADVADLDPVRRPVMLADRAPGGLDQLAGEFATDLVPAVVAQLGQMVRRGDRERLSGRVVGQDHGGQLAVERADIAGELRKAEVDQAVQLADPVVEVRLEPVAVADEDLRDT